MSPTGTCPLPGAAQVPLSITPDVSRLSIVSERVLVLGPEGVLQVCDSVVCVMGQGFTHQLDSPDNPVQLLALKHLTSSGISIHICYCKKLQEATILK